MNTKNQFMCNTQQHLHLVTWHRLQGREVISCALSLDPSVETRDLKHFALLSQVGKVVAFQTSIAAQKDGCVRSRLNF